MGFPNHGALVNARLLSEGASVRYLPGRVLHHGTDELVGLLERTGRAMQRRFALRLTVGDLSARGGGLVGRHRSHQSGRDADLAFFMRTAATRGPGRPVEPDDYKVFDRNGRSLDGQHVFDLARNWALVQTLLTDRLVRVERLFVSTPLRALLLNHARSVNASPAIINLAANTLVQPARVSPHDNHFHVRIVCPQGDRRCLTGVWQPAPRRRVMPRRRPSRAPTGFGGPRRSNAR